MFLPFGIPPGFKDWFMPEPDLDRRINTDPEAELAKATLVETPAFSHGMTLAELLGFEDSTPKLD